MLVRHYFASTSSGMKRAAHANTLTMRFFATGSASTVTRCKLPITSQPIGHRMNCNHMINPSLSVSIIGFNRVCQLHPSHPSPSSFMTPSSYRFFSANSNPASSTDSTSSNAQVSASPSTSSSSGSSGAQSPSSPPPRSFLRRYWWQILLGYSIVMSWYQMYRSYITPDSEKPPPPVTYWENPKHPKNRRADPPILSPVVVPATTPAIATGPAAIVGEETEPSRSHPDHASCRVCRIGGEQEDMNKFLSMQTPTTDSNPDQASPSSPSTTTSTAATSPSTCPPCYAYSHSLCPLNRAEVGRAAWGYLHTLVAYYPEHPTPRQQQEMATLLRLFMKQYPCGYCADRSMEQLEREPVEQHVVSQAHLTSWMCRLHNEVNERLNKPIFDCQYVNQRWRDGPPTGECD